MDQFHLPVRRSARIAIRGELDGSTTDVWVVLHGFGQLASRFLAEFETIAGPGRVVIAPEALNRFYLDTSPKSHGPESRVGATWMTREDRLAEIDDYVAYLDDVHAWIIEHVERDAIRLRVLGFSQGVATACRWLALGNATVDDIILWAGDVPADVDLEARRHAFMTSSLSLVVGDNDPFAPADRVALIEARLRAAEIPFRSMRFAGAHVIDRETLVTLSNEPHVSSRSS